MTIVQNIPVANAAILVVDPYNDFLSARGKLWPMLRKVTKQVKSHRELETNRFGRALIDILKLGSFLIANISIRHTLGSNRSEFLKRGNLAGGFSASCRQRKKI